MQTWSLIILYAGLGLALVLLRRQQGALALEASVDGLLWPMTLLKTVLVLFTQGLGRPTGSDTIQANQ